MNIRSLLFLTSALILCGCSDRQVTKVTPLPFIVKDELSVPVFEADSIKIAESIRLENAEEGIFISLRSEDVLGFRNVSETHVGKTLKLFLGTHEIASLKVDQRIDDGVVIFKSIDHDFSLVQLKAIENGDPKANDAVRTLLKVFR